jgi:hypothetical protein
VAIDEEGAGGRKQLFVARRSAAGAAPVGAIEIMDEKSIVHPEAEQICGADAFIGAPSGI